jgi:hypothetical protein
MKRSGSADLLYIMVYVPKWLAERMAKLINLTNEDLELLKGAG